MDRFPELQILISEKKIESSFINKKEALERGLLFLCLYSGSMTVRGARQHRHLERVTGRYAGLYGDSEPGDFLPPCFMYHGRKEISPLRFASVEMTEGAGRLFHNLRPLKGKRLTTFCASLALLHPLLSLTHWIFRSLMLPYKSSSHSAKCVRCAPKGATTLINPCILLLKIVENHKI